MRRIFCTIIFLVLITNSEAGCQDDASIRVLFIGNSYTYYHSMPQLFSAMAETHFPDQQVDVKFVGRGGATLKQLWEDGEALKEIRSGRWNYVILQKNDVKKIQNTVSDIFQLLKKGNGYPEVEKAVSDKKPSQFSTILAYLSDSKNQFVFLMVVAGVIFIVKGGILLFRNYKVNIFK